jgi:Na+-transporting NADH:ubiquinone oxidoreductase subunit F
MMILAASTIGTVIATVVAFLFVTLLLVALIVGSKTKIITVRTGEDYH